MVICLSKMTNDLSENRRGKRKWNLLIHSRKDQHVARTTRSFLLSFLVVIVVVVVIVVIVIVVVEIRRIVDAVVVIVIVIVIVVVVVVVEIRRIVDAVVAVVAVVPSEELEEQSKFLIVSDCVFHNDQNISPVNLFPI